MAIRIEKIILTTCTAALLCTFAFWACGCAPSGTSGSQSGSESSSSASSASSDGGAGDAGGEGADMDAKYQAGVMLITFAKGTTAEQAAQALASLNATVDGGVTQEVLDDQSPVLVHLADGVSVEDGVKAALACGCVQAAQPNFIYHLM